MNKEHMFFFIFLATFLVSLERYESRCSVKWKRSFMKQKSLPLYKCISEAALQIGLLKFVKNVYLLRFNDI